MSLFELCVHTKSHGQLAKSVRTQATLWCLYIRFFRIYIWFGFVFVVCICICFVFVFVGREWLGVCTIYIGRVLPASSDGKNSPRLNSLSLRTHRHSKHKRTFCMQRCHFDTNICTKYILQMQNICTKSILYLQIKLFLQENRVHLQITACIFQDKTWKHKIWQ